MARNKMEDLNNHLFAQLERLTDDLTVEEMEKECKRTNGIVSIAREILKNAALSIESVRLQARLEENGSNLKVSNLILEDKSE